MQCVPHNDQIAVVHRTTVLLDILTQLRSRAHGCEPFSCVWAGCMSVLWAKNI